METTVLRDRVVSLLRNALCRGLERMLVVATIAVITNTISPKADMEQSLVFLSRRRFVT